MLKSTHRGNFPVSFTGSSNTNTLSRRHSCGVWNVRCNSLLRSYLLTLITCLCGSWMCHILICKYGIWVSGCEEEEFCHVSDIRDEGLLYFACVLYPDTRVCGAYDKPLRQACSLVMTQSLQTAYQKKGESFIHKKVIRSLQLTNMVILFTSTWIWNNENTITQYTKWFCCHTPFHQIITYTLYYTVYYLFIFPSISCLFSETFLCDRTDGFCIALCRMRDCGLWWSLTSDSYHFHCDWVCRLLYLFSDMILATEHGMQMIQILVLLELDRDIRWKGKRRQRWTKND